MRRHDDNNMVVKNIQLKWSPTFLHLLTTPLDYLSDSLEKDGKISHLIQQLLQHAYNFAQPSFTTNLWANLPTWINFTATTNLSQVI